MRRVSTRRMQRMMELAGPEAVERVTDGSNTYPCSGCKHKNGCTYARVCTDWIRWAKEQWRRLQEAILGPAEEGDTDDF